MKFEKWGLFKFKGVLKMKSWWVTNLIWVGALIAGVIYVEVRKVDGAGIVQTAATRQSALIGLVITFAMVVIMQLIWWLFARK
ncbi:hypothetical protein IV38_GL000045 [Lactobacillus selangorensis]|uniref:DUF3923 domain-containing protein n=2 Tax=Lactobacillus selangorensis TaxID=81857 RepID=A0A0R2FSL8_9LACO|nr:hypothetical protein IV38_GL000045 [Lactobacillus selangorensis]KRN31475.1 hypothetical protein IV40_GL001473 [Lactobacillus selangorensis]